MFRILLVILILLPTISKADQGLKISCLNMKSMYGKKYEPLKFTLEAVGFQYFDQEKDKFVMIKTSELDMGEDHFTARFADYELALPRVPALKFTKPSCIIVVPSLKYAPSLTLLASAILTFLGII